MKVLVTGATGFVGRALLAEFDGRGFATISIGGPKGTDRDHSINVGDVGQVRKLVSIGDVDAVVHAAGIAHRFGSSSDDAFRSVNVTGAENVANLAIDLNAKHFLLISSTLIYGRRADLRAVDEDDECRPRDAYAKSKLAGEEAARHVCESARLPLTILRPAPIMGEGSKGNFARLIRAIDSGRFVWVGHGDNLKSVVYVGDVAQAAAVVLDQGPNGTQAFNVAAKPVRMKDVVNAIADALGKARPSVHLPARPIEFAAKAASLLGPRSKRLAAIVDTWLGNDVYSNKRLRDAYDYTPSTSLDIAVGREVGYYLNHK